MGIDCDVLNQVVSTRVRQRLCVYAFIVCDCVCTCVCVLLTCFILRLTECRKVGGGLRSVTFLTQWHFAFNQ